MTHGFRIASWGVWLLTGGELAHVLLGEGRHPDSTLERLCWTGKAMDEEKGEIGLPGAERWVGRGCGRDGMGSDGMTGAG
jgi:hypothetical protein